MNNFDKYITSNNNSYNNLKIGLNFNEIKDNEKLSSIFKQLDKNNNGIIEENELFDIQKIKENNDTIINDIDDNNIGAYNDEDEELTNDLLDAMSFNPLISEEESLKTIETLFSKINKDNVSIIINNYQNLNINQTSLFEDIMSHIDINIDNKLKAITTLKNKLIENSKLYDIPYKDISNMFDKEIEYQKKLTEPNGKMFQSLFKKLDSRFEISPEDKEKANGKIDKPFQQGRTGDCWLISALNALNNSLKGAEILNKSIKFDNVGNALVTLKGINKTFKITPEELYSNNQYSTGDKDIRLIEIAIDKYFYETREDYIDLDGNQSHVAFNLLTGKDNGCKVVATKEEWEEIFKEIENNPNFISTVASCLDEDLSILVEDKNSHELIEFTFQKEHGYAILDINDYAITIADPNNSKNQYLIPKEPFMEFFTQIDSVSL